MQMFRSNVCWHLATVCGRRYRWGMFFVHESRIEAPPEAVFAFHETPDALTALVPPWERMHVVETAGSLRVGSRVVLRGRVGFVLPVRWVAVHTEYDPPHLFADQQETGPFAYWYHRHRMLPDGSGTLLRDEVEYRLPLGWLGRICGGWFVRRKLHRMFAYRHEVTKRAMEVTMGDAHR